MTAIKKQSSQSTNTPAPTDIQATSEQLHWVKVNNISHTTTEDSFEYFLLSLFPIENCYLVRNDNGFLEGHGFFSIRHSKESEIQGGFLSINGQTHTLDTVDLSFEIVDHPSSNSPLIKLFHLPNTTTESVLREEISKYGTIDKLNFSEGARTARLNLSNPIESKACVASRLFINEEEIGIKFAGDELGNDDVLLNGRNRQSPRNYHSSADDTKLYLTGFTEEISCDDLKLYFEKFGRVKDSNMVNIQNKYGPGMIRYGFLHLDDPNVGRKILEQRYHQIGNNRVLVQHSISKGKDDDRRNQYNRQPRRRQEYRGYSQGRNYGNSNYSGQQGYDSYDNRNYNQQYYEQPPQPQYHQQGAYPPQQQWQPEMPPREYYGQHNAPHMPTNHYNEPVQGQGYDQRQYDNWQGQPQGQAQIGDFGNYNNYRDQHRGFGGRTQRGGRRR